VVVVVKGLGRFEQHTVVAVLLQKAPDAPEHARVVIDHKHRFLFRQDRWSCSADLRFPDAGRRPSATSNRRKIKSSTMVWSLSHGIILDIHLCECRVGSQLSSGTIGYMQRDRGDNRLQAGRLSLVSPARRPSRSAIETSSARVCTCIFSMTRWRCALMVRSVAPS